MCGSFALRFRSASRPIHVATQVAARGAAFLDGLVRAAASDRGSGKIKHVLVVSHGGFIKTFLQSVCQLGAAGDINNTSFSTVDVTATAGSRGSALRCKAVSLNDTGHLKEGALMSESAW